MAERPDSDFLAAQSIGGRFEYNHAPMPMQRTFLKGLILCALVGLSGCAIDWPVYQSPKLDLPPAPARKPASVDRQWWKAFEDPALDGLVADALANNLSLAKAAANQLIACGVMGILNFSPIVLHVPEEVMVNNVNLAIELENLSYFIQE